MRAGGDAPGEEQALDYLLANAAFLGLREPLNLRLRPHDSDPPGRWDAWIAARPAVGAVPPVPPAQPATPGRATRASAAGVL